MQHFCISNLPNLNCRSYKSGVRISRTEDSFTFIQKVWSKCWSCFISDVAEPMRRDICICGLISDGKHICRCLCGVISLIFPKHSFVFVVHIFQIWWRFISVCICVFISDVGEPASVVISWRRGNSTHSPAGGAASKFLHQPSRFESFISSSAWFRFLKKWKIKPRRRGSPKISSSTFEI